MSVAEKNWVGRRYEEFLTPEHEDDRWEIIEGEFVALSPSNHYHTDVLAKLTMEVCAFLRSHPHLNFSTENGGYLIRRNPDTLVCPDMGIFRADRKRAKTFYEFTPEVAVEVFSPKNTLRDMAHRRKLLFEEGTEQFWVFLPKKFAVEIYFSDGRTQRYEKTGVIVGEGFLKGLTVDLKYVFG
ncbi:hypothetical protein BH09SUM1_BH09SUM1_14580 [soil metagenome]